MALGGIQNPNSSPDAIEAAQEINVSANKVLQETTHPPMRGVATETADMVKLEVESRVRTEKVDVAVKPEVVKSETVKVTATEASKGKRGEGGGCAYATG